MFKIAAKQTFTHDVSVLVPADGGHEEQTLKTTFNFLDSVEVESYNLRTSDGSTAFLKAAVHAFHDLTDDNNNVVPYTVELRDQLLRRQDVRAALAEHYFATVSKAKEGN